MSVIIFYEQTDFRVVNALVINTWVKSIVDTSKYTDFEVSIIFTNNEYLLGINKQYLSHDYLTDIITFDYTDSTSTLSGELFISVDMLLINANEYAVQFKNEMLRVIAHGILHLLGYDDKTEEDILLMRQKEEECISLFKDELFVSGI